MKIDLETVIISLCAINLIEFVVYALMMRRSSVQIERLIDKACSRNYAEWAQTEKLLKEEPKAHANSLVVKQEDDEVLEELNAMFGLKT